MAPRVHSSRSLVSTIDTRDTQGSSNNQVPVAGIVIGSVFGLVLVICIVAYLFSSDNFIRRRGWLKIKKGPHKSDSQHLSPPDDQESLTKRASFVSERESMMFSRSRASSLQFAVVEDMDSQRRMSSQVYVLRGEQYVPLQQVDTERNSLLSHDISQMSEVDMDNDDQVSIPVVVSPPPDNTQTNQQHHNVSRTASVDHSDAVSEVSTLSTAHAS
jgi:hypothetical protein